jgi:hypothetical protein
MFVNIADFILSAAYGLSNRRSNSRQICVHEERRATITVKRFLGITEGGLNSVIFVARTAARSSALIRALTSLVGLSKC